MIDEQITLELFGYVSNELKPKSNKKIVCVCENCGRYRLTMKFNYTPLCNGCARFGRKMPPHTEEHNRKISESTKGRIVSKETRKKISKSETGKYVSEETKQKIKDNHARLSGENNPMWKGGISDIRDHLLPINQCIQLNERFIGSNGHHIMSRVVIFIPRDLHQSIWHDLKNNKNIKEINKLSLNYLLTSLHPQN